MSSTVSVRELRQNLSVYLRRVEHGESLSVTSRGRPVAVLGPLPGRGDPVGRLVAERGATRPTVALKDLPPPLKPRPGEPSLSEVLDELRGDTI